LVEVMTDKATVAIPSPKAGRVVKTHGKEGEIAKVHHPLVTIELDSTAATAPRSDDQITEVIERREPPAPRATPPGDNGGGRVLAPAVTRRMAREHGINLADVSGTGPQGRVTKADVMAAIGSGSGAVATGSVQPTAKAARAPASPPPLPAVRAVRVEAAR